VLPLLLLLLLLLGAAALACSEAGPEAALGRAVRDLTFGCCCCSWVLVLLLLLAYAAVSRCWIAACFRAASVLCCGWCSWLSAAGSAIEEAQGQAAGGRRLRLVGCCG